jgi:iron complex outermembrane receptor protein
MTARLTGLLFCLLCTTLAATARSAEPATTLAADIGPRPVAEALAAFVLQTGLQLIYVASIVDEQQSKGARAGLSVSEALAQLLDGTGLRFEFLNARTVRIFPAPTVVPTAVTSLSVPRRQAERPPGSTAFALEQVIVTARRREERASQVPIDIAIWNHEAMERAGVKSISDLAGLTPAVEYDYYPDLGPGNFTNVSIRGVNSSNGTSTGIYLDDTPLPASRDWNSPFGRPFPVTFDLQRVEVLRGPQGTLSGEAAEGGVIRFITNEPDVTTFSALAHSELATTVHGSVSYEAGAAAGGPLVNELVGFRLSAWYRTDGGYVDRVNPFTGALVDENANRSVTRSVRAALTFAPASSVRVTPSFAYQSVDPHDSPAFYLYLSNPGAGALRSGKLLAQPVEDRFYLGTLKLTAAPGFAELTSVTSYFSRRASVTIDSTNNPVGWGNPLGPEYPASYADALRTRADLRQTALSQEVRFASSEPNAAHTWVAGAFASRARYTDTQEVDPSISLVGRPQEGFSTFDGHENEFAVFGQASLKMRERLTASVGLRVAHESYSAVQSNGTRANPAALFWAGGRESPVTPRFDLTYHFDDSNLLYASVAKGYRTGGLNPPPTAYCGLTVPTTHAPDWVWSYEVGSKSRPLGGRVQFEASAFYIDWQNVQSLIIVPGCGTPILGNVGAAASKGFDLLARTLLTGYLDLELTMSYTDAHYTRTVRFASGVRVDRGDAIGALPVVISPWNITSSVDIHFPLATNLTARIRVDDVFHSRNPGPFYSEDPASPSYDPTKRPDPSTNLLNLRAGVRWSAFDLDILVDNALDSRPLVLRRNVYPMSSLFVATTFRPRTVGMAVTWHL